MEDVAPLICADSTLKLAELDADYHDTETESNQVEVLSSIIANVKILLYMLLYSYLRLLQLFFVSRTTIIEPALLATSLLLCLSVFKFPNTPIILRFVLQFPPYLRNHYCLAVHQNFTKSPHHSAKKRFIYRNIVCRTMALILATDVVYLIKAGIICATLI